MTVGPLSRIIGPNWVKYNTNEGKILHPRTMASEKMATFSHFVHHVTNEEAILLDLQVKRICVSSTLWTHLDSLSTMPSRHGVDT